MWRQLGIIAIYLTLFACGPDVQLVKDGHEEYYVYWDDSYNRYFRHGLYQSFYESGRQRSVGKYEQDIKVGVWTHWYENGQKQGEMDWVDGKPEGVVTEWYKKRTTKKHGNVGKWWAARSFDLVVCKRRKRKRSELYRGRTRRDLDVLGFDRCNNQKAVLGSRCIFAGGGINE